MSDAYGSIWLIRYVPDPRRGEGVNVGLAYYAPGVRTLTRFATDFSLARRLNPKLDPEFLDMTLDALDEELYRVKSRDDIENLRRAYQGFLQLSPGRTVEMADPHEQLGVLFNELIAPPVAERAPAVRRFVVRRQVKEELRKQRLESWLQPFVPLERITGRWDPFRFDWGVQQQNVYVHTLSFALNDVVESLRNAKVVAESIIEVLRRQSRARFYVVYHPPMQGEEEKVFVSAAGLMGEIGSGTQFTPVQQADRVAMQLKQELLVAQ